MGTALAAGPAIIYSIIAFLVKPAPDVSGTTPAATESDTAANATFTITPGVALTTPPATEVDGASTAINPLEGFRISDPLGLPGDPITASKLTWDAVVPAGATLIIETSLNNGASWDLARNGRPVPRLRRGDTVTRRLLTRVTFAREHETDPKPRVRTLKLRVTTDAGTFELVPIFYGRIDKATRETTVSGGSGSGSGSGSSGGGVTTRGGGLVGGGQLIKVHALDLSYEVDRNRWTMPYAVPSGLFYGDAVAAMIKDRRPAQERFSIAYTEHKTPLLIFGTNPGAGGSWRDIADVATAVGCETFFDPTGLAVFRQIPDPRYGDPVLIIGPEMGPKLISVKDETNVAKTFNHVIVRGESTSSANPVVAEAFDDDPASNTYINGPYGRVTLSITLPQVKTPEQAQAAANGLLYNSIGRANEVTVTIAQHPALETGDIIRIDVPDLLLAGSYMVQTNMKPANPAEPQTLVLFRQSTQ